MMRSLFSGVSGLKNHQTRMDVIGNNISNVNTTGFKSGRVTFVDSLNQTLTGASSADGTKGGTNPKQIGLGSAVSTVDTIFTDGSVQSTGKNTDLCLSGSGLFVVKDTTGTYYTRNGAFEFDEAGNYVMPGSGLFVQGWMAKEGTLSTSGEVGRITIPAGKSMASKATNVATYTKNLDASAKSIVGMSYTRSDGTTLNANTVEVDGTDITLSSAKFSNGITLQYSTQGDKATYDAKVANIKYTKTMDSNGVGNSNPGTVIIDNAAIKSAKITMANSEVVNVTSGTWSNTDVITGITYMTSTGNVNTVTAGNSVTIGGGGANVSATISFSNGKSVTVNNGTWTLGAGTPPTGGTAINQIEYEETIDSSNQKTITAGGTGISNVIVTMDDGQKNNVTSGNWDMDTKIESVVYTNANGDTMTVDKDNPASMSVDGNKILSATLKMSDGSNQTVTSGTYTMGHSLPISTTINVYDSLGSAHTIPIMIEKAADNTWIASLAKDDPKATSIKIIEEDGTVTTVDLVDTKLPFTQSGSYDATKGSTGTLRLSYGNGAANQTVMIDFSSVTQYSGSSTINADADGNAAGTLKSVSVDSSGIITGTYTNGIVQKEAQVAVAQFNNPAGLTKNGSSMYTQSNNSGVPNVKAAADLGVTITASALEMSNVDIANEFSDMIITQRGFQSNSKIITVSDEMLETLINMKR